MTLSETLSFDRAVVTSLKLEPGKEESRLALSFRSSFSPHKRERFAAKICSTTPKDSRAMVGKVFHCNGNSKES